MLKSLTLILCLTGAAALPFLCRMHGETPKTTGTCGPEQTADQNSLCLCCYNNTADIPTIGLGFNLLRADARDVLSTYNLDLDDVMADCRDRTINACLNEKDAIEIFHKNVYPQLDDDAEDYVANMPPLVKAAVADIAFSGYEELLDEFNFPNFRENLRLKNYRAAATALNETRWCRTAPHRCAADSNCIASICPSGGECNKYAHTCSSNEYCMCQQTDHEYNVCAPNFYCNQYPSCANCPTKTAVCVTKGCCGSKCIPRADLRRCPPATSSRSSRLSQLFKKPNCLSNNDCPTGQTCGFFAAGKYCTSNIPETKKTE